MKGPTVAWPSGASRFKTRFVLLPAWDVVSRLLEHKECVHGTGPIPVHKARGTSGAVNDMVGANSLVRASELA